MSVCAHADDAVGAHKCVQVTKGHLTHLSGCNVSSAGFIRGQWQPCAEPGPQDSYKPGSGEWLEEQGYQSLVDWDD